MKQTKMKTQILKLIGYNKSGSKREFYCDKLWKKKILK